MEGARICKSESKSCSRLRVQLRVVALSESLPASFMINVFVCLFVYLFLSHNRSLTLNLLTNPFLSTNMPTKNPQITLQLTRQKDQLIPVHSKPQIITNTKVTMEADSHPGLQTLFDEQDANLQGELHPSPSQDLDAYQVLAYAVEKEQLVPGKTVKATWGLKESLEVCGHPLCILFDHSYIHLIQERHAMYERQIHRLQQSLLSATKREN